MRPQPTDNLPATIALRGCTWKGTAPHAVTKTKEPPSVKKMILVDENNAWPKASTLNAPSEDKAKGGPN